MTSSVRFSVPGHDNPVGVGLKLQHYDYVLENKPSLAFFEVHAENYMMPGGAHHRYLEEICDHYALSLHGVGMSLGSADGISKQHLARFRGLVERYRPWLVSEHLAWSQEGGLYMNDLLPLPLTEEALSIVADNVMAMQDAIGRRVLIENPSSYLAFKSSEMPEQDFLERLADRTGCGLLLDVNNVVVSGRNMGWDIADYLDSVPAGLIGEVHLAGHLVRQVDGIELRIDDHGSRVSDDVWRCFERLIERVGPRPVLVEWDTDVPEFSILAAEAERARQIQERASGQARESHA